MKCFLFAPAAATASSADVIFYLTFEKERGVEEFKLAH